MNKSINNTPPIIGGGNIIISKEIDGTREITQVIPTSFSKVSKRNYKEKSTMKISTSTSIVIIEPDMQKDIHHALKHCGVVSSYQIFGFIVDARVVNNGQAIIFDAYFPINDEQNTMKYHETFMIKWSDFENFYLLNRGGV